MSDSLQYRRNRYKINIRGSVGNDDINPSFSQNEKDAIAGYLKNPTSNGLIKLEAEWKLKGDFRQYLVELLTKGQDGTKYRGKFDIDSWLQFTDSPYLLLYFFSRIVETESIWKEAQPTSTNELIDAGIETKDGIVQPLKDEYVKIVNQYSQAYEYFKKHLYNQALSSSYNKNNRLIQLNGGFFVVTEKPNEDNDIFCVVGFKSDILKHLGEFYRLLGKIEDPTVYTMFSPDDELLKPYVIILSEGMDVIRLEASIKRQFIKMIDDLDNQSFTSCVNTAGLVTEEYLTQIYETLTRSPIPSNLMLGSMATLISDTAHSLLSPKKARKTLSQKEVMDEIKKLSKNKDYTKAIAATDKAMIDYTNSKIRDVEEKVRRLDSTQNNQNYRIFPELIRQKLDDVIKYRNAASHKSTYPIDSRHALRSIYASLSIALWWDSEKRLIDGSKSKIDVVKELIGRAEEY